jgi:diphosphomevalonate decarboxylase
VGTLREASAQANSNIAFIKYWGNADDRLRLPVNPSMSINLDGLHTNTTVIWDERLASDELFINQAPAESKALNRVSAHLNYIRDRLGITSFAQVRSVNNFPMGAGIASSASSFAALTVAAVAAAGGNLSEKELTTIARLGSGSAARSIPTGFVEWHTGTKHEDSFAASFAPPDHWELIDVIAIISSEHKSVTSSEGHPSAKTSDLQDARVAGAIKRFNTCKQAIFDRDFETFAEVVERDSNLMHAVMMTSRPPLFYWQPATLTVMDHIRHWRAEGVNVCYTLDAGPNVHCICLRDSVDVVSQRLQALSGVQSIRVAKIGGPAKLIA